MDERGLWLALPSVVVLVLLVLHSVRARGVRRALLFWGSVSAYGVARGLGVRLITEKGLGGSFPYVVSDARLPILGVPAQEIAGWGIAAYLAWWIGERLARRLSSQVLGGALFLGSLSLGVEAAAAAAGWWRWTIPSAGLFGVPFIGLVDWFFVGADFLFPFLALSTPGPLPRGRLLTLLVFPAHFAAHLLIAPPAPFLPIPTVHLVHWALLGTLVWLALRSEARGGSAPGTAAGSVRWVPAVALGLVLADLAVVLAFVAGRPEALPALLPALVLAAVALGPGLRMAGGGPVEAAFRRARGRPAVALFAIAAIGVLALAVHGRSARAQRDLVGSLDRAIAARDAGDLDAAARQLESVRARHPASHVPAVLLGEIEYRRGSLEAARRHFSDAISIQPGGADAYRRLAVIELRLGRREEARRHAAIGLEIDREDEQLRYLAGAGTGMGLVPLLERLPGLGPDRTYALAALAFEVGDAAAATAMLEAGRARWPQAAALHRGLVKLTLAAGDHEAARRAAADWRAALPDDAEAREAARRLGLEP